MAKIEVPSVEIPTLELYEGRIGYVFGSIAKTRPLPEYDGGTATRFIGRHWMEGDEFSPWQEKLLDVVGRLARYEIGESFEIGSGSVAITKVSDREEIDTPLALVEYLRWDGDVPYEYRSMLWMSLSGAERAFSARKDQNGYRLR